jgi:hypothetical protein
VALAQHKIEYEYAEYLEERDKLEHIRDDLELCAKRLAEEQSRIGRELYELRSRHSQDFQRGLALFGAELADYRHSVTLLKEFRRTIEINRRNFLINSVALVSAHGARTVAQSIDPSKAAFDILANSQQDHIFAPYVGWIQRIWQQLESDIDYADPLTERHAAWMKAATDQLQIAGERELGEMAHHLSIDSAAVVASIAAVIMTAKVELKGVPVGQEWLLVSFPVVGSFAATQILSSRCQEGKLSLAIAAALFAGYLHFAGYLAKMVPTKARSLEHFFGPPDISISILIVLTGFLLGLGAHWVFKQLLKRK